MVRAGDREAFGTLWRRHAESASVVARQYRGIADPQDIVQEASRRVLNAIVRGGGPFGDFRPYMNQTVRNVAVSWSREHSADPVGDIADFAEHAVGAELSDHADGALERMITVRAFKSLPKRWQTVLWYAYVEGMGSDETADHLGLSRNAAAALIGRAREGLRQAWLKAHLTDESLPVGCRQVVDLLPSLERDDITDRQRVKVEQHLDTCARCSIIAAEVNDLATQLPILLLPLVVAGFDVLAAPVEELLAYDPTAVKAVGEMAQSSAAHTPLPRPSTPQPTLVRAGLTPGRIWLMSAVAVGGIAAAVIIVNLAPDTSGGRPPPDAAGFSTTVQPTPDPPTEDAAALPDPVPSAEVPSPAAAPTPAPSRSPQARPRSVPRATSTPDGSGLTPAPTPEPPTPEPLPVPTPLLTSFPAAGNVAWLGAGFTFAGTGVPGSTVEVMDGTSGIATVVVGADGRWSVAPPVSLTSPGQALAIGVRQVAADGRHSLAVPVGSYTFAVPQRGAVLQVPGGTLVDINGSNGMMVEASVDGGAPTQQTIRGTATTFSFTGLAVGDHAMTVRYVNGAQTGASVTYVVKVP